MSITTKLAAIALAALAVTGSVVATSTPAAAGGFHHHPHWGVGAGIGAGLIGAAIVGSAIAASDGYDYAGYPHCRWVPRFDVFGHYAGRVRACDY